jgi:tetratricopeptide (TPR) repeat protein
MSIVIEEWQRWDRSLQNQVSEAFYARRAHLAWSEGDLPYLATSNTPFVHQCARFLVEVVQARDRAAGEAAPVVIMEIGTGHGRFLDGLLRSLRDRLGSAGQDVLARLTVYATDHAADNVRAALAGDTLGPWAATGVLVPATFDVREPALRDLAGREIDARPFLLFASYVWDSTPARIFRSVEGNWLERYCRLVTEEEEARDNPASWMLEHATDADLYQKVEVEDFWKPIQIADEDPRHRSALEALAEGMLTVTIPWFPAFLEFVAHAPALLAPGGMMLLHDFGSPDLEDLEGYQEPYPRRYGNALCHPVNTAILDPWARVIGMGILRNRHRFRALHTALVVNGPTTPVEDAFERLFVREAPGEDYLDFAAAGKACHKDGDVLGAVRMYTRCLDIAPDDVDMMYRLSEVMVEGGWSRQVLPILERGISLDPKQEYDFNFLHGRVLQRLNRFDEAMEAYLRSLQREDHHVTWLNIALVEIERRNLRPAWKAIHRSLALKPEYARAVETRDQIRDAWCKMLDLEE